MEITNISCPIQLLWNWQYGRTRKHLTFLLVWTFLLTSLLFESCFGHKYVPEFNDKLAFEIAWHGAQEKVSLVLFFQTYFSMFPHFIEKLLFIFIYHTLRSIGAVDILICQLKHNLMFAVRFPVGKGNIGEINLAFYG